MIILLQSWATFPKSGLDPFKNFFKSAKCMMKNLSPILKFDKYICLIQCLQLLDNCMCKRKIMISSYGLVGCNSSPEKSDSGVQAIACPLLF